MVHFAYKITAHRLVIQAPEQMGRRLAGRCLASPARIISQLSLLVILEQMFQSATSNIIFTLPVSTLSSLAAHLIMDTSSSATAISLFEIHRPTCLCYPLNLLCALRFGICVVPCAGPQGVNQQSPINYP